MAMGDERPRLLSREVSKLPYLFLKNHRSVTRTIGKLILSQAMRGRGGQPRLDAAVDVYQRRITRNV